MSPRFLLIIIIIPRQAHDSAGVTLFVPEKTSFFFLCQASPTLFSFELTYAVSSFSYPPMAESAVFPLYISSHVFIFLHFSLSLFLSHTGSFYPLFFLSFFSRNGQTSL